MKSVYAKILLWCIGTLIFSWLAFIGVGILASRRADRGAPPNINAILLEQSVEAYTTGGPARLAQVMAPVERHLPGRHYLTDSRGIDLITGENRSALLASAEDETVRRKRPGPPRQHTAVLHSADGKYHFIIIYQAPRFEPADVLPYQALILVAVALLCWVLAKNLASPLRDLARTVDRFGAGDLTVRVHATRQDEIGDVSRAFDRMADRISTLLTAERRLLQDISHELRSPLARLSFAAELARTAPDRNAAIARLNKEIARLTDLVGGLIQVTRAEGDPSAQHAESLRLDQLLVEIVEDCRVEAAARDAEIKLDGVAPLSMHGDREVLRRAIENVLRNAIRYTPSGSEIEVKLDGQRISIRDHGPGVPEDALAKIFQPFFRLDDSRDTATGGVGLGLAIAQRAARLHHGKLWAENAHPGLKVWIELPVQT
jgi:two-component system sensor histidine kinase CpxA